MQVCAQLRFKTHVKTTVNSFVSGTATTTTFFAAYALPFSSHQALWHDIVIVLNLQLSAPSLLSDLHDAALKLRPVSAASPSRPATRFDRSSTKIAPAARGIPTAVPELWKPLPAAASRRRAGRKHVWAVRQLHERPGSASCGAFLADRIQAGAGVLRAECMCPRDLGAGIRQLTVT